MMFTAYQLSNAHFNRTVQIIPREKENNISIHIINSNFKYNKLECCSGSHGALTIRNILSEPKNNPKIIISGTMLDANGNLDESKRNLSLAGIVLNCYFFYPLTFKVLIEHLTFSSNEVIAMLLFDNAAYDSNNVTIISNQKGGVNIISNSTAGILSSRFIENNNAALMLDIKMQN